MSVYHDEIEIEDFEYDEETETYYYPCPCGDRFEITRVGSCELSLPYITHAFHITQLRSQLAAKRGSELPMIPNAFDEQSRS